MKQLFITQIFMLLFVSNLQAGQGEKIIFKDYTEEGKVNHSYCKNSDSGSYISSTFANNGMQGFALASMILGISAAVLALIVPYSFFAFLLGTTAIVFGGLGLWRIIKLAPKWKGKSMSLIGIVMGIVVLISFL